MNEQLTKKLLERFPVLYQDYYVSMQETCMCWGFEHDDGWFDIIWQLSLAIEDELGYTERQKRWFLRKKRWSQLWNDFVYKLSPVRLDKYELRGKGTKEEPYRQVLVEKAKKDWAARLALRLWAERPDDLKTWVSRLQASGLKTLIWFPFTGHKVDQVKEKFGTLRYYCAGNDRIFRLVSMAEYLSEVTCEHCGKLGAKLRPHSWVHTYCDACEAEWMAGKKIRMQDKDTA